MGTWFRALFLGVLLTVLGNSEKLTEDNIDRLQIIEGSAECDSTEYQRLRDRLESLESAVKSIVTALASQKNEIFAPITAILEQNAALNYVILSSFPISQDVPENSTILPDFNSTTTTNSNVLIIIRIFLHIILISFSKGETIYTMEEKHSVNQLKGAVKCSLAQLLDINFSGIFQ
jgi:hypothetical protein